MPATFVDAVGLYAKGTKKAKAKTLQVALYQENDQKSRHIGTPIGLIYHWSAGTYDQAFDGYNYSVCFNPTSKEVVVVKNLALSKDGDGQVHGELGYHLWGRNTGMLSISFSAMRGAAGDNYGKYPIRDEMIVVAAYLGAEVCYKYGLNPRRKVRVPQKACNSTSIWSTGREIDMPIVTDHATYAQADGYAGYRWDITKVLMDRVMKHLLEHYDNLVKTSGKASAYSSFL